MINKSVILTTGLCASLVAASASAAGSLNLYNFADYINPLILENFQAETGVEVTLDTYTSNEEMLAKLQAGATGYDLVFPSVHMHDILYKLDFLEETGINQHPLFANIDPTALRSKSDPTGNYCLPYAWGTVGVFYNQDITGEIKTWEDFFNVPARTGAKIAMVDDMREVLGVGLMANGYSVNTTNAAEIKVATDYILARKDAISAFTYASPGLIMGGDIAAAQFFVGFTQGSMTTDNIKYMLPEDGTSLYQEDICMLKSAPNKDNAKAFMEFMLIPENAALNVELLYNGSPNMAALEFIPDNIKNDPSITVPAGKLSQLHIFEDVGKALKLYDRAWNTIKASN